MTGQSSHSLLELPQAAEIKHLHAGQSTLVSGDLTVFLHEASDGQWLNIKVAGLEIPFAKDSRVVYRGSSYIWPAHQEIADLDRSAGDGYIELTLLPSVSREQRDMFTSILQTWCSPQALGTSGSTTPVAPAQPEPFPEDMRNQVLMLNEEGEVIGDLAMPVQLDGDMNKAGHEQDPVVVEVSGSTAHISPLRRLTSGYGQSSSKIVSGAEYFSRGLITAAEKLSTTMATSSSNYAAAHPVPQEPLVFHPAARKGICGLLDVSNHAATISSKTFGLIGNMAGSAGGKISNAFSKPKPPGAPPSGGFRGALRNSLMALNTVIESVEASGKHVWENSTQSTARVARHKYGPDAGEAVEKVGKSGQNFALVYVDARGVGRTALLKNVGKGAMKARFSNGQNVVLQPTNEAPLGEKAKAS